MTSFIDWTFYDPDYTRTTSTNTLNFGTYSTRYTDEDNNLMVQCSESHNVAFVMSEFGFGKTDSEAGTQYYYNILNTYTDISESDDNY